MAESTLSLASDDLKAIIGHYLGYGRGAVFTESAWTTPQSNNITDVLRTGLSTFYNPPQLQPNEAPHSWSFLRPFAEITLAQGVTAADLPDDFGYFEGPLYLTTPSSAWRYIPLQVTNAGRIEAMQAGNPDTVGAPRMCALEPIAGTTLTEGTRYRLHVWPKTDQVYNLQGEYKHLPDMLTGDLPYPPGGSEHADTIKAACLASAELHLDDVKGPRWQYFMERLAASVAIDRRKKGWFLGKNIDRSDRDVPSGRNWRDYWNNPVTYNGNPL